MSYSHLKRENDKLAKLRNAMIVERSKYRKDQEIKEIKRSKLILKIRWDQESRVPDLAKLCKMMVNFLVDHVN